jgi:hypothetical protein
MSAKLTATTANAEELIKRQLAAYNAHDLEAFLDTYAPDVRFFDPPDLLKSSGIDEARKRYGQRFSESPKVHVEIANRIVQGNFVMDHETVSGLAGNEVRKVGVIYEVRNGKIQNVWFLR